MFEDNESFVDSVAKTNKLYCSDCLKKIIKGESVVFKLSWNNKFLDVYCSKCKDNYRDAVIISSIHPHDDIQ
jgi:RNase P subunit RPR2